MPGCPTSLLCAESSSRPAGLGGASRGERAADTACNAQGCTGLSSDHFLMVQRKEVTQPLFGAPPSKVSNPVPLRMG